MNARPAWPDDAQLCAEWSVSTPHNGLDASTAQYPLLYTFAIEDERGPVLYIPTHPVLAIESAACRPGITPRQYIEALLQAKAATEEHARSLGMKEIYTSSEYTPMAKTLVRHGYQPLPGVLRKRL